MALPLSGPLSFSAIAGELGIGTPYSLRSMSSQAGFSTPDSVSEFYGYSAALEWLFADQPQGDPNDSCAIGQTGALQLYTDSDGLVISNRVYTDSNLTTALNGEDFWWYNSDNNTSYQIDGTGNITDELSCK
jgi:hypothetical protein